MKHDGVYYAGKSKEGDLLPEKRICSHLKVLARTRDPQQSEWGVLLEWRDYDNHIHKWAMPLELLRGDSADIVGELLRRGLDIPYGKKNKVVEYIQSSAPYKRITCTDKTGWHNHVYVTPEHVYGDEDSNFIYQSGAAGIQSGFSTAGTLNGWRENVARYAQGNSRLVFSISMAFAGSLVGLANIESGGVHFSGGSKDGKTTVLLAAASVFGHPDTYKRTYRATANALEGVASLHNDGFLPLDELKQCTPKEAGEVVYMLANGQDKARMKDHGGLRALKTWRLLFLSTGEISLVDYLKSAGIQSYAGQEVRLANIPADAGKGYKILENLHGFQSVTDFFTHMHKAIRRHHGTAGAAWLETITSEQETIRENLPDLISQFVADVLPNNNSTQADTVAKRAALVAIAGELATKHGLTGWQAGEATAAAKRCFRDWLAEFGTGDREDLRILDTVRAFIERNGDKFMNHEEGRELSEGSELVRDLVGFHRLAGSEGREYLILASQIERVVEGFNVKQAVKALLKHNWISKTETDSRGYTVASVRVTLPRFGRTRCYFLNLNAADTDV
ncbi:DUF927 domain-containing protein [Thiothrix nivea]|uniref:DUF927 domain-containing protein n=1 Tax=Thiothrix nivea (strain ATCC 35100 / DSM 5205 / JP2) TaxID=870187 RepID=A0A656HDQ1_THINJ|nr:DUF927 domain-containing protein [Thiothrix nivea]EIJ33309.1 protein of unknown function DUF927 [Thiothrix nivea DSM 5205]